MQSARLRVIQTAMLARATLARLRGTAVLVVAFAIAGCTSDRGPVVTLEAPGGPVSVRVEIADTPEAIRRGLMWRSELADDAGMLFVFTDDQKRTFWMKNTPISLDILFIDRDLRVVSIARSTEPYSLARIPSGKPARYVLEVAAGFAARHRIEPGTRVRIPDPQAG